MAGRKQAVGVIGLGTIGSRVAANLRRAGYEVWVWNRSPKAEPNFLSSPAEVAEAADIVLLFLADGPAVLETLKALSPALTARHLIANHSTISPEESREAAQIASAQSAGFLDAPFTGSRDAAEANQLVYYVAGSKELIDRVRPILSVSSQTILEFGEVGQASLVKLAGNLIAAATVEALAEAAALVDSNGVPATRFLEVIANHGTRSKLADAKLPLMVAGNFETHFALRNMFKDIQLALSVGRKAGIDLPVAAAAGGALMAGMQKGWGDQDFSAIASHYEFPGKEPVDPAALAALGQASEEKKPASPAKLFPLFGGAKSKS